MWREGHNSPQSRSRDGHLGAPCGASRRAREGGGTSSSVSLPRKKRAWCFSTPGHLYCLGVIMIFRVLMFQSTMVEFSGPRRRLSSLRGASRRNIWPGDLREDGCVAFEAEERGSMDWGWEEPMRRDSRVSLGSAGARDCGHIPRPADTQPHTSATLVQGRLERSRRVQCLESGWTLEWTRMVAAGWARRWGTELQQKPETKLGSPGSPCSGPRSPCRWAHKAGWGLPGSYIPLRASSLGSFSFSI